MSDVLTSTAARTCSCRRCLEQSDAVEPIPGLIGPDNKPVLWPIAQLRFIVCAICGNKRCPHATDHRYCCTGSNESGQAGSIYA